MHVKKKLLESSRAKAQTENVKESAATDKCSTSDDLDIRDCLTQDLPLVIDDFKKVSEELFPNSNDDGEVQLMYGTTIEDAGIADSKVFSAFIKQVSDKLREKKEIWLVLDTGATQHVIKDVPIMKNKKQTLAKVIGVNGNKSTLDCKGDVSLQLLDSDGVPHSLNLRDVYGMKMCPFNLISVSKLIDEKYWFSYNGKTEEGFLELPNSSIRNTDHS
jgi:hypothetical protein